MLVFMFPIVWATTRMTRLLGLGMADTQQRLLDECSAKEVALCSLANSQMALSRVLRSLCNVVVQLDADLRLRETTWEVRELFNGCFVGDPQGLEGRSLLDFMATDAAGEQLRSFIASEVERAIGFSPEQEQGPASILAVDMKDSEGVTFTAQLYHTCLGTGPAPAHLLGICLAQDPAMRREPPPGNDTDFSVPWDRFQATLLQIHQMRPGLQRAASSSGSGSQAEEAAPDDSSSIAVRFDAGTDNYKCTRNNLLSGPLRSGKQVGILDMLSQADVHDLERWVFFEVSRQDRAAHHGRAFEPAIFPRPLTLKLPKTRQVLQAESMWIRSHDRTPNEEVPVTMWLQDINVLTRSQALAALDEEDVDVASESGSDLTMPASASDAG